MISRFLSFVILVPLAILIVVFCVANRAPVTVSLDPFGTLPQFVYQIPLFLALMAALIVGTVIGGIGTWFTQAHYRSAAWKRRQEIDRLKREADDARERLRQERESRAAALPHATGTALAAPRPV
ncbi:lipopolysaccharide assembly protein LapA domain-containing protein [Aureimonas leprariae]|uniref:LapA family protein n=1 Tax=Plantimonas leprariae TaxID=2615207 RepID=A0A7V7PT58_9HYPH|nr:LapA family protein [Aureimonas leprariae]KAB0682869.1 LapA family protein [Aureimonas leprariae]